MTTAIYPNRIEDKQKVESLKGWKEEGDDKVVFYTRLGYLFAIGYKRIVYGDHGPYIEFERAQIKCALKHEDTLK